MFVHESAENPLTGALGLTAGVLRPGRHGVVYGCPRLPHLRDLGELVFPALDEREQVGNRLQRHLLDGKVQHPNVNG